VEKQELSEITPLEPDGDPFPAPQDGRWRSFGSGREERIPRACAEGPHQPLRIDANELSHPRAFVSTKHLMTKRLGRVGAMQESSERYPFGLPPVPHQRVYAEEVALEGSSSVVHEVCPATSQLGDDLCISRVSQG
jgi:hypothetical protein